MKTRKTARYIRVTTILALTNKWEHGKIDDKQLESAMRQLFKPPIRHDAEEQIQLYNKLTGDDWFSVEEPDA